MSNVANDDQFSDPGTATTVAAAAATNAQYISLAQQDLMQNQLPPRMMTPPPPLASPQFNTLFEKFIAKQGILLDERDLSFEGKSVDLASLHREVMVAGAVARVNAIDEWPIIGAKLGFVQFPGNITEPAKSGPDVANFLKNIYSQYLELFDSHYIKAYLMKFLPRMGIPGSTPRQGGSSIMGNAMQVNGAPFDLPAPAPGWNNLTQLIEAQDKSKDGVSNGPLPPNSMQHWQQARTDNIAANQPSTENPHIPHPSSANGLRHPNGQAPSITLNQPPAESQLAVGANGGSNEQLTANQLDI